MPTFDGLVVRIIDELAVGQRTAQGDLPRPIGRAEVENEVRRAIEFYSTTRFWFNEANGTLTTSSSLAAYNWPSDLLEVDSVTASDGSSRYPLRQVSHQDLEMRDTGTTFGRPVLFAMWAEQFRFFPVPNGTYTIAISYQKRLATISVTSDTNAWTTIAQDLIANRVIGRLCAGRLRDPERAGTATAIEMQELARLLQQNEKTASSGRLSPND